MVTANVFDFRKNLAVFLDEVEKKGTKIVVKRFDKPVAIVIPYTEMEADFKKYRGFLSGIETGEAFVLRVRRNKNESGRVRQLRARYE